MTPSAWSMRNFMVADRLRTIQVRDATHIHTLPALDNGRGSKYDTKRGINSL